MKYNEIYDELDLARYNQQHGFRFFDENTIKFFKSRILNISHKVDGAGQLKILFITSEKAGPNDPSRVYSLRLMQEDGRVKNLVHFSPSKSFVQRLLKLSYEQIIAQTQN